MDLKLVMRAAAFAAHAHAHQKRKTGHEPYVNHLIRVAESATAIGLPSEAIAAALLHDSVEDTAVTIEDVRAEFPERVARLVHLLTQWWPDDASPEIKRAERPKYYGAIMKDPEAVALKLLDRADNLRDMARMLPLARGWAERYLKRSEEELASLVESSDNEPAKRIYFDALETLRSALERTPVKPQQREHNRSTNRRHRPGKMR